MKLNLNTGLSALPKIGAGTGPAPWPNTYSTEFDGVDDYIGLNDFTLNTDAAWSISLWTNLDDFSYAYPEVFNLKTDEATGFVCFFSNVANYGGINFGSNANFAKFKTTGNIGGDLVGAWVHIVLTYNGSGKTTSSNYTIYVNGSSVANATTAAFAPVANVSRIGVGSASAYFDGKIDEFSIWNTELTSGQVSTYYNSGAPTNLASESGLVFWNRLGDSAVFNADSQWEFREQTKINNWSSHSFEFDGVDQYMELDSAFATSGTDWSISFWWKSTQTGGNHYMVGRAGSSYFGLNWNKMYYNSSDNSFDITSVATANDGVWHHGVFTYNYTSGAWKFYIDGSLDTSQTATTGRDIPPFNFFGARKTTQWFYAGNLDEISYFSTELTSGNVTSIYASGVPNDVSDLGISGLQGYWRMGEGADWNNTNWQVPDYSKNALFSQQSFELDGVDQYVSFTQIAGTFSQDPMSIDFWISIETTSECVIIMDRAVYDGADGMEIWASATRRIYARGGGGTFIYSDSMLDLNTWYHVAVTYNSTTSKIYINGVLDKTGTVGAVTSDSTHPLYIGVYGDGAASNFGGMIDSVSIWHVELTSGNVTSIFGTGKPNDISGLGISGLIGWWKMGEGSSFAGGNWTIPDASTNSNDGTSANMNEVDKKYISPGNEASGESSGMSVTTNTNNAPDNENQGLSVGMVSGSVVEETP